MGGDPGYRCLLDGYLEGMVGVNKWICRRMVKGDTHCGTVVACGCVLVVSLELLMAHKYKVGDLVKVMFVNDGYTATCRIVGIPITPRVQPGYTVKEVGAFGESVEDHDPRLERFVPEWMVRREGVES